MQITVEVEDGSKLATDLESWTDGDSYQLTVRQTTPMKFEAISGEPVEPEEESEEYPEDYESEPPMPKAKGKSEMPPALMIVMGKRK